MKYILAILILINFVPVVQAQTSGQYKRYTIDMRVAKPLPSIITNNITLISNVLDKIKAVSVKIKNYEETATWSTDNTNDSYRTFKASFAVPYPLPQQFLDEQATFEGYLVILSNNAMASNSTYTKIVQSHICNN